MSMTTDTDRSGRTYFVGELFLAAWQSWPVVLQVQQCKVPATPGAIIATRTALRLFQLSSARDGELALSDEASDRCIRRPGRCPQPLTHAEAEHIFGPLQPVWRFASMGRTDGPVPEVSVQSMTRGVA